MSGLLSSALQGVLVAVIIGLGLWLAFVLNPRRATSRARELEKQERLDALRRADQILLTQVRSGYWHEPSPPSAGRSAQVEAFERELESMTVEILTRPEEVEAVQEVRRLLLEELLPAPASPQWHLHGLEADLPGEVAAAHEKLLVQMAELREQTGSNSL